MKRSTKYQRICDAIKNDIRSGYYSPGEKLPSERKLSQHYNAAHATINKAVRELVTCGFLSKVDSLGTFVTKLGSSETPISGKYCLLAGDPGKSGEFGEIAIALLNGIMSQAAACGMRTQLVSTTDLHNELLRYSLFPQSLAGVIFWMYLMVFPPWQLILRQWARERLRHLHWRNLRLFIKYHQI